MLSDDEIRRRLLTVKHSPREKRFGRHIPTMNSVATSAGLSRERVYRIALGLDNITDRSRTGLTRALATCHDLKRARTQSPLPS